jgi:hypothetical protein
LPGKCSGPGSVGNASAFGLTAHIELCGSACSIVVAENVVSLLESDTTVVIEVVDWLVDPFLDDCLRCGRFVRVVIFPCGNYCCEGEQKNH